MGAYYEISEVPESLWARYYLCGLTLEEFWESFGFGRGAMVVWIGEYSWLLCYNSGFGLIHSVDRHAFTIPHGCRIKLNEDRSIEVKTEGGHLLTLRF